MSHNHTSKKVSVSGRSQTLEEAAQEAAARALDEELEQHHEEERRFEAAGWGTLDCSRPFYRQPTGAEDGTKVTVAQTPTGINSGGGFEWYKKEGDCPHPCGHGYRSVLEARSGEWVCVTREST